ncbi:lysophospholipid acyltransferase family protein [Siminovitchia fortis]|uniref:1-acyl-sn-glycerol-3-phosphate acyltransferase n=1 Tax=Siminovitchia fortis TaxID=254758 RepID=A0A443J2X5_9BACI|nr:lysophospholipid acyltransferase family protein [Siminovitchia fortis]RWR14991.1 1-acyl-sn-glycerol-3-phosphate acyltransferase [Siminovitchia fortis]WHY82875.1 lysophospholipid acyltransferase family protein [Siminovitchia fortis]
MTFYQFSKTVVNSILRPLYRIEVRGIENFPKSGGVLLCTNHISNLDPPVVGITCPRPVSFMAKEELFRVPILKSILPNVKAFPVKRGMSDRGALRKGLSLLKEGEVLGLFPEGTRSKTGKVGKGLAGAGFFALRSDAEIIPCAIIGPYKPFKKLKVVYGKPIDFTGLKKEKISVEDATEIIMGEIKKIIDTHQD